MNDRSVQRGFSLIEIMVGLVIGLIAILVIGQVTAVFEGQKRTSTGGGDAQTNGMVAMGTLQDDIAMAGLGLVSPGLNAAKGNLFCPLGTNVFYDGTVRSNPGALPSDGGILAPVRIIEGASGASDEIVIVRSDAEFGNLAMQVRSVDLASSPPNLTVDSWPDSTSGALRLGQVFLLGKADGSKVCSLLQMTKATNVGAGLAPWKLEFGYNPTSYPYNPSTPTVFASFPTYGDGDVIVNLGDSAKYVAATQEGNLSVGRAGFVYRRYGIHCDKLAAVDPSQTAGPYDCANTTPLVDEIVDIQAQYGIAPAGSQSVSEWRNATGTWAFNSVAAADIARIKAVRISVVARSPQYEKPDPSYSGGHVSPATLDLWVKVNAGDDPAPVYTVPDRDYRYKVFTTIVPMKNVIWGRL